MTRDDADERVDAERFGEKGGDSVGELVTVRGRAHRDHRHFDEQTAPSGLGEELPAAHLGHHQVEQHEGGRLSGFQTCESVEAVLGGFDVVPFPGENHRHELTDLRVVVEAGAHYAVSQQGADVVVELAADSRLVLVGVQLSSLHDGWIVGG